MTIDEALFRVQGIYDMVKDFPPGVIHSLPESEGGWTNDPIVWVLYQVFSMARAQEKGEYDDLSKN